MIRIKFERVVIFNIKRLPLFYLIYCSLLFISCKTTDLYKKGASYLVRNEALNENIIRPVKYISYKKFLFEFVTKTETVTGLINSEITSNDQNVTHNYIYVLSKDSGFFFKADSFKINCLVFGKTNIADKKGGILVKEPDEVMKKLYGNFKRTNGRDTIINNLVYKFVDTSYFFNDTMRITNQAFFINIDNFNSVFNTPHNNNETEIKPFTLAGIIGIYKSSVVAKYLITDIAAITKNEIEICEDIIKKIAAHKQE